MTYMPRERVVTRLDPAILLPESYCVFTARFSYLGPVKGFHFSLTHPQEVDHILHSHTHRKWTTFYTHTPTGSGPHFTLTHPQEVDHILHSHTHRKWTTFYTHTPTGSGPHFSLTHPQEVDHILHSHTHRKWTTFYTHTPTGSGPHFTLTHPQEASHIFHLRNHSWCKMCLPWSKFHLVMCFGDKNGYTPKYIYICAYTHTYRRRDIHIHMCMNQGG